MPVEKAEAVEDGLCRLVSPELNRMLVILIAAMVPEVGGLFEMNGMMRLYARRTLRINKCKGNNSRCFAPSTELTRLSL